jgi:predicted membrane-bound spermidine synthase
MISECFKTFYNEDHASQKVIGIVATILMTCILIFFCVGLKEEIRYSTLEDYFNGKIEVTQDSTIVRTYKFNNHE